MRKNAFALALAFLPALVGPTALRAAESVDDARLAETIYAVRLNAVNVSEGAIVLLDAQRRVFIDEKDLKAWRLRIAARAVSVQHNGARFVRIDSLGPLTVKIDDALQELVVSAAPQLFERSEIDTRHFITKAEPVLQRGAFLNYDFHSLLDTTGPSNATAALEGGIDIGNGVLTNSELVHMHPGGITRLATAWQSDDVAHDRTLGLGDGLVSEATIGGTLRFAGIRLASNFTSQQNFTTSPQASVLGTAALPSTVDVYVNNVLAVTQNVQPGVFRIENLPQIDGEGNVQLVVKDILGQQQVITRSYYGAASLLRAGLDQYEFAAGFARADYGTSNAYGKPLFSGTERHGFTDRFTGEAHVEGGDGLLQSSLDGSWLVPTIGDLTFGLGVDRSRTGGGSEMLFGDEFSSDRSSYGVSLRVRSAGYSDLGTATNGNASSTIAANYNLHVSRHASVGVSYAQTASSGSAIQHVLAATFGGSIGPIQIAMNAINPLGGGNRYFSVNLLRAIGRNSISASQTVQNGVSSETFGLQHSAGATYGASYAITGNDGPNPYVDSRVTGAQPHFDYLAGFASDGREQQTELDLNGSLAAVDGHAYLSRRIQESYGVAELDGLPGVNVYLNNQLVGRTDATGRVLIPNMQSYQPNAVSIDPQSLPLATNVGDVKVYAAPYYRSPAIVRFKHSGDGGLILPVREFDGTPSLAGGVVIGPDGTQWPIADHGEAYVGGLSAGSHIRLDVRRVDGTKCSIALTVPADIAEIPTSKPVICTAAPRPSSAAASPAPGDGEPQHEASTSTPLVDIDISQ